MSDPVDLSVLSQEQRELYVRLCGLASQRGWHICSSDARIAEQTAAELLRLATRVRELETKLDQYESGAYV